MSAEAKALRMKQSAAEAKAERLRLKIKMSATAQPKEEDQAQKTVAAEAKRIRLQKKQAIASMPTNQFPLALAHTSPPALPPLSPKAELALRRFQGLSPTKSKSQVDVGENGFEVDVGVLGHLTLGAGEVSKANENTMGEAETEKTKRAAALELLEAMEKAEAVAADTIHEAEHIRRLAKVEAESLKRAAKKRGQSIEHEARMAAREATMEASRQALVTKNRAAQVQLELLCFSFPSFSLIVGSCFNSSGSTPH